MDVWVPEDARSHGSSVAVVRAHCEPFDGGAGNGTLGFCKSGGHLFTPEPSLQPLPYIFNVCFCLFVCLGQRLIVTVFSLWRDP